MPRKASRGSFADGGSISESMILILQVPRQIAAYAQRYRAGALPAR
jgi:hypothetical protein